MIKNFLLFLSKTDVDVYNKCPNSAKQTQLGFGLFVLLTGILAFCSGTYAILNMFTDFDWKTETVSFNKLGYIVAPILGSFYCLMIMAIDREVVAAKSKATAVSRLLLAIIIGVIVAIPIELKLLEGRIEKQLIENYKKENSLETVKKETAIGALKKKRDQLQNNIEFYQKEVNRWSEVMEQEVTGKVRNGRTGKAGEGPAYREARRNMDLQITNKQVAQNAYNNFIQYEYNVELKEAEKNYESQQIVQQFDLLSKFQALHQIVEEDETKSTWWMSWGIRILFILFEIIPSLIKIMTSQTEYDALLEARRRMNIQLTNARANEAMIDLKDDINGVLRSKRDTQLPYMNEIERRIMT
jgi:hypothetical protein